MPSEPLRNSDRRRFLEAATVGAVSTAALLPCVTFAQASTPAASVPGSPENRIRQLELLTAEPLESLEKYYRDVLELPAEIVDSPESENRSLHISCGETMVVFRPAKDGNPFYHFAFNIPENKILSARNWLAERTTLMETPRHMIDPEFPEDIRHFRNWNAHSVFFWDPAGNILELIARHDLKNSGTGEFRAAEIMYASEIGFVTNDVDELARQIQSRFQLPQYRDGSDAFRAIGDEQGLLLVFREGNSAGADNQRKQAWSIFPTEVEIRNEVELKDDDHPYRITAV